MERFQLKSFSIAFDVPFFNLCNQSGLGDLTEKLNNQYLPMFDCLNIDLKLLDLDTKYILLYNIVILVDTIDLSQSELDSKWNSMKTDSEKYVCDFLDTCILENGLKLPYRIIR